MDRSPLSVLFLVILIMLTGFGLIMPLIPFFASKYGANELTIGGLVASYAAMQFIGAPLMGRLSDRKGRRLVLAICLAGTMIGFLLLGLAETIGTGLANAFASDTGAGNVQGLNTAVLSIMFFSQMISGLAGGSITVAQAYVADITDATSRMKGMGMILAAFGIGFIVGPIIGGVLSRWGYALPAYAASGLSALSLITILIRLPESLTEARKTELAMQKKQPFISINSIIQRMRLPRLGPLLIIRLVTSIALALFMSLFVLWAKMRLDLDAQVTSYLMAYTGVLSIVTQFWLISPLTRRFSQAWLLIGSIATLAVATLAWAFTSSIAFFMVIMIPHSIATSVLNTVVNSAISWAVSPQEMGDALGTSGALESLSRVVAPTLGGWMLGSLGAWAPGLLGAVLLAFLAVYAWQRLLVHPDPKAAPA